MAPEAGFEGEAEVEGVIVAFTGELEIVAAGSNLLFNGGEAGGELAHLLLEVSLPAGAAATLGSGCR